MQAEVRKNGRGGTATKAVAKDATLHLDLLRVPCGGRLHLHSPQWGQVGLAASWSCLSHSGDVLWKPGAGMLAGSIIHGALALQRLDQEMVLADRTSLLQSLHLP